jgi:hypothetical protein
LIIHHLDIIGLQIPVFRVFNDYEMLGHRASPFNYLKWQVYR